MTYTPAIQRCKVCGHAYLNHGSGDGGECSVIDCTCEKFDTPSKDTNVNSPIMFQPPTPTAVGMTNPQAALLAAAFSISSGFEDAIEIRAHKFESYLDVRDSIRKEKDL
jgi:hypothetical protein